MYSNILIPTDGSPLAEQAVSKGIELAKGLGAKVTVVTVVEPFEVMRHFVTADHSQLSETYTAYAREADVHAKKVLEAATQQGAAAGVQIEGVQIESGYPYEAIVKAAEDRGCDLIVMSSHGRKGLSAVLVGSETMKVLTHTKLPVLVLR